jgi:predicted SAM-dependent methyltransferase
VHCDLKELRLPDECADVAISIHVVEHFYAWEVVSILKEWHRVLKPGAKLILELPCMDKVLNYILQCANKGIEAPTKMIWNALWGDPKYKSVPMTHKWGYTKKMIQEVMELAGFKDIVFEEPRYHFPIRDMRVVGTK